MQRMTPLGNDESYHVFNRGAHKGDIFTSPEDYERMLLLLFVCNSNTRVNMRDLLLKYKGRSFAEIFKNEQVRDGSDPGLVSVLAYSLMPNHYHLVLRQEVEDGISKYLKKICTAYSMYFNTKYEHSGTLFQGRFKSSHLDNEAYFRYIFSYVHLNPVTLIESDWEVSGIIDPKAVRKFMNEYRYSSYYDYCVGDRPEGNILSRVDAPDFLSDQDDLEEMLEVFAKDRPL